MPCRDLFLLRCPAESLMYVDSAAAYDVCRLAFLDHVQLTAHLKAFAAVGASLTTFFGDTATAEGGQAG